MQGFTKQLETAWPVGSTTATGTRLVVGCQRGPIQHTTRSLNQSQRHRSAKEFRESKKHSTSCENKIWYRPYIHATATISSHNTRALHLPLTKLHSTHMASTHNKHTITTKRYHVYNLLTRAKRSHRRRLYQPYALAGCTTSGHPFLL